MQNRSLLFIPAKEKTLLKITSLTSDSFIIDLEDSIEEVNKEKSLQLILSMMDKLLEANKHLYVRLNKSNYVKEATMLASFNGIGFMLPKFEDPDEYNECVDIWKTHEVIALVETPLGIVNIKSICKCDWVRAVAFGAEDYTANVNMANEYKLLYYQKSMIITYCRAYGKKCFDTPSFQLTDLALFRNEVLDAVSLGFDGKMLIHPKHIQIINEDFSSVDIDYMIEVVKAYEAQNEAVFVYNGRPFEKMHISRFRRIIKEHGGIV